MSGRLASMSARALPAGRGEVEEPKTKVGRETSGMVQVHRDLSGMMGEL